MRRLLQPLLLGSAWIVACARAEAGASLTGKIFDGDASAKSILQAMRQGQQFSSSLKLPLVSQEVEISLLDSSSDAAGGGKPARSWKTTTDGEGSFSLDTGMEKWPDRALVIAQADRGGRRLYSMFLKAAPDSQDVHLYPLTEGTTQITADFKVAYDLQSSGDSKMLRIRYGVRVMNRGGEMYVGRKAGSAWREIWRVPFPKGAVIGAQNGPYPGVAGWRVAADGGALILDTPVPGVCDFESLKEFWTVEVLAPVRQTFVQSFSVPAPVDQQAFTAWCTHEEMSLSSPQLANKDSRSLPDPFSGEDRSQDVLYSNEPVKVGLPVTVILTVDNVAAGQAVSLGALKWVGGFVLVLVLSVLLGLALGPKGPSAEALLESLSGEALLDRVADLDARFSRGEIQERDYKRLREPLVALAAEEAFATPPQSAPESAPAGLPDGAREVLQRIDAIESSGRLDAAAAAERAHLLEALARALPREAIRG